MKLLRLIVNLFFLAVGVLIGVVWGVHHPDQATNIAQQENVDRLKVEIAGLQDSISVLQNYGGKIPNVQATIAAEQQKLTDAQAELAIATTQPSN